MKKMSIIAIVLFFIACQQSDHLIPTVDDGNYLIFDKKEIITEHQHLNHFDIYSPYVNGYNTYVLKAIDKVQATAPKGGGYFIGIHADPPESPIGYDLNFQGKKLLDAPRTTSYCSGASYAALVEALNMIYNEKNIEIPDSAHLEAMRMQEIDGGRREDHVKFWGKWNANGFGSYFALVQYTKMGMAVSPVSARPGDFMNISWKSGLGHSVVFLGWVLDEAGKKYLNYWSSQKSTNGLGDQVVSLEKIKEVKIVRLTNPEKLNSFSILPDSIDVNISGEKISF